MVVVVVKKVGCLRCQKKEAEDETRGGDLLLVWPQIADLGSETVLWLPLWGGFSGLRVSVYGFWCLLRICAELLLLAFLRLAMLCFGQPYSRR